MPAANPAIVLRFGVFEVNLPARELRKHGIRVHLSGQPFSILAILLERPGDVVTREEMQRRLWASDTFVDFEHSLNSAVKKLRAALGDTPENSRYIETVPRMGYRFIAPVESISAKNRPTADDASRPDDRSGTPPPVERLHAWRRPALLGIPIILIVAAVGYFQWSRTRIRPEPASGRLMLAVLPFDNLTGDPGQDYFSDGLTEEMIAQLGRLDPQRLGVIARTSVMHYKHGQQQMDQIGRELGVQYVLEGSVRRDSEKVRISAQLIQMKDQSHLWARQYDRELSNLLAVQGEIAQEIAGEIQLTLGDNRAPVAPVRQPPLSPQAYEAYDLYLKGRFFWNKRTTDGFQQAIEYFQQAIAKDPTYARAYAGLADSYALVSSYSLAPQNELMPKARTAALKALQIDERLAEAHTSLALVYENYDWDWPSAEKEYLRAIQLDPNYATAHQWYAECLTWMGRFDEALRESERARQLDPLSVVIANDHGAILYYSRNYDRAIEQFRTVFSMDPNFSRAHMLIYAYVEKGMFPEALANLETWHHDDGTPTWELEAYVYARWGRQAQARLALAKWERWSRLRHPYPYSAILMAYIAMGRKDDAFAWLDEAFSVHSIVFTTLNVEPAYDPLRSDPRFQDLLRRLAFPK